MINITQNILYSPMFKRLKRGFKRVAIFILILIGIAVTIMTIINLRSFFNKKEVVNIIIDSDTGSEAGSLFAIVRALIAPELNVICITSAQWQTHPNAPESSVRESQSLNDSIIKLMRLNKIPTFPGAEDKLSYWSDPKPQSSEASAFIITEALKMTEEEKLNIVILGSMTNVATAVMTDPSISPRIRVYCMGAKFDTKTDVWNKNEFNIRNDLDAFDLLLNTLDLEMHILTSTLANDLKLSKDKIFRQMQGNGGVWALLLEKWREQSNESQELIVQDLALIEAIINPQFTKSKQVITPPENVRRNINVYTYLNIDQMLYSFENAVRKAM